MQIISATYWLPKAGNSHDEYEDAACPVEETHDQWELFKCAIADGATETSFARDWAELLVNGYVEGNPIELSQAQWMERTGGKELPWYAEQKREDGAFAAFAGLTLYEDGGWDATACGDSCLVQLRETSLVTAFPLQSAEQFSNRPALLRSHGEIPDGLLAGMVGAWKAGDSFMLMTDALAKWFYQRYSQADDVVLELEEISDQSDLERLVAESRTGKGKDGVVIANDDVTLLRLIVGE